LSLSPRGSLGFGCNCFGSWEAQRSR
jgi:hypothetical protein